MQDQNINHYVDDTIVQIANCSSVPELEEIRVKSLGKKGFLTMAMKGLKDLTVEEKKNFGQSLNEFKKKIANEIDSRKTILEQAALEKQLASETLDVTLPVTKQAQGSLHPIHNTIDEVVQIFAKMGFSVVEGPDIEDNFHNFEALNFPKDHPAKEMHDTFYIANPEDADEPLVLRTHTSPVQIRTMIKDKPPLRVLIPGRTFRNDYDATHSPMFHQIEGLVIDKSTHMGHLKGCLIDFCREFFDVDECPVRFRPSFFPFTEPSAEVDIGCHHQGGELKIGEGSDWLEILGCGMVHPNVIRNAGLDPEEYQGFAFGMGVERMSMLKYGIPDLRKFFECDLRWLKHYGFSPLR